MRSVMKDLLSLRTLPHPIPWNHYLLQAHRLLTLKTSSWMSSCMSFNFTPATYFP